MSDAVDRGRAVTTAGEIVTVVADRSDGYSDIALAWADGGFDFTAIAVLMFFPDFYLGKDRLGARRMERRMNSARPVRARAGGRHPQVRRHVADPAVAAIEVFPHSRPGQDRSRATRGRSTCSRSAPSGAPPAAREIVIYLSMRERRAEIVADEAIAIRVEPEVWGEAMAAMLDDSSEAIARPGDGRRGRASRQSARRALPARRERRQHELPDRLIEL